MTIEATRMPYDKAELYYVEAALYQEFELERENKILPFNATVLEQGEDNDGEVIESERPPKIRRITKPDGKVVGRMASLTFLALLNSQEGNAWLENLSRKPLMYERYREECLRRTR